MKSRIPRTDIVERTLFNLQAEIGELEQLRRLEVLNSNKSGKEEKERKIEELEPWSKAELSSLIRGVFKFGENEWSELIEDIEVGKGRSANEIALKWRDIKMQMQNDIREAAERSKKLASKHEWMIAALVELEKDEQHFE